MQWGTVRYPSKAQKFLVRSLRDGRSGGNEREQRVERDYSVHQEHGDGNVEGAGQMLRRGALAVGLCGALLLSPLQSDALELRFPASGNPEIFTAQKTLVQAWSIVRESYVDGDGGMEWQDVLKESMQSAYDATDGKEAYNTIQDMLEAKGDPYTRIIPPEEYANFRVSSDGELQGVGLFIASDPSNGKLMVLSPVKGSPADRAGILPGDELLSIDGHSTQGLNGPEAARELRGRNGTSVMVKLARRTEQIPGVPGTPESRPKTKTRLVSLKREVVELSPVYYSKVNEAGQDLGYIKLLNFSSKAAVEMKNAISDLQSEGVGGLILDLRNNPGGLVDAGLDVSRLFLEGSPTIFNVSGREDSDLRTIGLEEGHAATTLPLVVVVNQDSASASEILAGALKDNHRATLIGDRTFGKGKIQTVFELNDGSALFVTVARYKTPENKDIDLVGIKPDLACQPNIVGPAPRGEGDGVRGPNSLRSKTLLEADLEMDDCFLTAERFLYKNSQHL